MIQQLDRRPGSVGIPRPARVPLAPLKSGHGRVVDKEGSTDLTNHIQLAGRRQALSLTSGHVQPLGGLRPESPP